MVVGGRIRSGREPRGGFVMFGVESATYDVRLFESVRSSGSGGVVVFPVGFSHGLECEVSCRFGWVGVVDLKDCALFIYILYLLV